MAACGRHRPTLASALCPAQRAGLRSGLHLPDRVRTRLDLAAQAPTSFGLVQLVDRWLAMLEQIRRSKRTYPELQVVMVVMDDLPLKAWNVAVKALAVPGVARRSAGLGLDQPPLGPIREVPMIFGSTHEKRSPSERLALRRAVV